MGLLRKLGNPKVLDSLKDPRGPFLVSEDRHIPTSWFTPCGRWSSQRMRSALEQEELCLHSPGGPQAGGQRMRDAGRGVVNGAFCLPEFGAGGSARRRGGADGGGAGQAGCEVGGERKWRQRRRRRPGAASAGPRGRQATAEAIAAAAAWAGLERAATPQSPRSGSPRGRAPETKGRESQGAAGGRSVGQRGAGQPVARGSPYPGRLARPQGGKMPRVVPDQRSKFENEEFFRKLSRECEVRQAGGTEAAACPEWAWVEKSLGGIPGNPGPARPRRGNLARAAICPQTLLVLIGAGWDGGRAGGVADLAPDFGPSLPFRLSTRASGTGPTRSARRASRTPAATAARKS